MSQPMDNEALAMPGMIWKENTPHQKDVIAEKSWIRLAGGLITHYGWILMGEETPFTRVINIADGHRDTVIILAQYTDIILTDLVFKT